MYADIEVKLLNCAGNDIDVCNDARISFNKYTKYLGSNEPCFENEKERNHSLSSKYLEYLKFNDKEEKLKFKDFRLIHFLARKNHWTPFAHNYIKLYLKVPFFIAQQLEKSSVGFVQNSVSRRYYDGPIELYKMNFKEIGEKKEKKVSYLKNH